MIESAIVLFSVLLSLLIGIVVVTRNASGRVNLVYGIMSLSFIALGVSNYLSLIVDDHHRLLFARLVMLFTVTSVALAFYFVNLYFKSERMLIFGRLGRILGDTRMLSVVSACLTAISLSPFLISSVSKSSIAFGPAMVPFVIFFLAYIFMTIGGLIVLLVDSTIDTFVRSQSRLLAIGFVPIILLSPITSMAMPLLFNNLQFIALTPLYSTFFVAMVGYAILKHRLFGVHPVIIRSVAYAAFVLLAITIYGVGLIWLLSVSSGISLGTKPKIMVMVLLLVSVILTPTLRKYFNKYTNKLFFKDAYDQSDLFSEINKEILNNISVEPLAESVTGIVKKSIKVHSVDIVLWLGDKILCYGDRATDKNLAIAIRDEIVYSGKTLVTTETVQEDNRQLYNMLVASKVGGTIALSSAIDNEDILGLLVLGVKNSGAPFNREDAATLGIVAGDLSVAVQNSLHYEEIQKFNETLQAKVDDATRKLQRTNDKLKQLDETKDEFISMASHQLRTPLTSVKGYLSMVLEGDVGTLNDMQRKLLMQSFNSSQRMVYLISDLLNLSRLRTGKFIIEPKVTNLADVIEGEVEQLSANAKGRGLTLNYNKPKNFPDLYMDETKIRQVIMNFADNAIYYTPSGGKIDINLVNNKDTIEFTVVDNGIGVPLADQKHMFTKFYRAKNAQKARPDGTGLGIFMAKKVIIAQGGALIFESKPDKGSTFGFSISKSGLKVPE